MELVDAKALLAIVFLGAAATALLSMLSLIGRAERSARPSLLRKTHRVAGYTFAASAIALAVLGVRLLSAAGDGLPVRSVLHWMSAVVLLVVLAIKVALARRYRKLLNHMPLLGLILFTLAVLVAAVSLGFALVAGR